MREKEHCTIGKPKKKFVMDNAVGRMEHRGRYLGNRCAQQKNMVSARYIYTEVCLRKERYFLLFDVLLFWGGGESAANQPSKRQGSGNFFFTFMLCTLE